MSENSNIEWTDHTFNPWEGCQKVGPGCDHCYAETRNARFGGGTAINWGPGAPRRRTSASNWNKPLAWNAAHDAFFAAHGRRQRVFCASLADVFDNEVDTAWRMDLFSLIAQTPNLDWLILTKRIGNVMKMCSGDGLMFDMICSRVWLGATIVNQEEADRDIAKLLAVPARVRFLSMEPLLGPVDLCNIPHPLRAKGADWVRLQALATNGIGEGINWVIVGGESGPGARPMHPDWARDLRAQCAAAGVPFLFKQWGEWRPAMTFAEATNHPMIVTNRAVKATTEAAKMFIPMSGCFHMQHQVESMLDGSGEYAHLDCSVFKAGKKAAGRLLDGVQHDGYPEAV